MMDRVAGVDEPLAVLEGLRRSALVTLRARGWLARWRAASRHSWNAAESSAMIANALELAALAEFVAVHRQADVTEHT
jgi:hypothetical protein